MPAAAPEKPAPDALTTRIDEFRRLAAPAGLEVAEISAAPQGARHIVCAIAAAAKADPIGTAVRLAAAAGLAYVAITRVRAMPADVLLLRAVTLATGEARR